MKIVCPTAGNVFSLCIANVYRWRLPSGLDILVPWPEIIEKFYKTAANDLIIHLHFFWPHFSLFLDCLCLRNFLYPVEVCPSRLKFYTKLDGGRAVARALLNTCWMGHTLVFFTAIMWHTCVTASLDISWCLSFLFTEVNLLIHVSPCGSITLKL